MKTPVLATMFLVAFAACGSSKDTLDNNPGGKGQNVSDEDGGGGGDDDDSAAETDEDPGRPDDSEDDEDWSCTDYNGAGDGCDCGCGEDPDCGGEGCSEPGCYAAACEYCYEADGWEIWCTAPAPEGWTCDQYEYADGYYCDCGCGVADPDCEGVDACSESGCDAPACDSCHTDGEYSTCTSDLPPAEWTCDPYYFNDGYTCNCGCGAPDPDCEERGCSEPGCDELVCNYCVNAEGVAGTCPSDLPPEGWVCTAYYYSDASCDCGCGARDQACDENAFCDENGCSDSCDYCYDANGAFVSCDGDDEGEGSEESPE